MKKIAVVYWSGTGNTEAMANAVCSGINNGGGEASLFLASSFNDGMIDDYDAIAFGCLAMGFEELEENEFRPMFDSCLAKLSGKKIALFGSYGWGDGEWMRNWEETCKSNGAVLGCESVICNSLPGDAEITLCNNLGKALL